MKGLSIEDGKIQIVDGSRTVATTDGTLVCMLPTVQTISGITANFPDLQKDWGYRWQWDVQSNPIDDRYAKSDYGDSFETAIPQEYFNMQTVMAAPTGADFFSGRFRISRTTNPTRYWNNESGRLDVIPPQNVWIPFMGGASIQLEAEPGFARMMHIYLSGGNLVLARQQSVSVYPAGWGSYGDAPPSGSVLSGTWSGGEWVYGSKRGIPLKRIAFADTSRASGAGSGGTDLPSGATASPLQDRRHGHSAAVSTSGSTNYRSIYTVDIVGRFGRRS